MILFKSVDIKEFYPLQVIMRGDDVRYNRFLVRLLLKHPEHICLSVLNGHACVASGTYKYALGNYMGTATYN